MPIADEWSSLDAWLSGEEVPPPTVDTSGPDEQPPQLEGQDDANSALRRLARLGRHEHDIAEVAEAEIDRVRRWLADRQAGIDSQRAWVESSLESYMRAHHEATGNVTLDLPNGTLRLRPKQPKVDALDAAQWPQAYDSLVINFPDLVKIERTAIKAAIKKAAKPGPVIELTEELGIEVPEGYAAHFAVDDNGQTLPGVYFLTSDERAFTLQVRS